MMKNLLFSTRFMQFVAALLLLTSGLANAQWKEQTTGGASGYQNAVRYNTTGDLYTVLQDANNGNKVTVQKQNGASWSTVGTAGFSTYMVYEPTMAVNQANGDLYVAYMESVSGVYKLSCNKFNGTSWVDVGAPEFLTTGATGSPGMTIDNNGNPVIVTPTFSGFVVYRYNGSSWDNLTTGATSNYNSTIPLDIVYTWGDHGAEHKNNYFPFADSNGDIYVAISSAGLSNNGVSVFKYAAGTWTKVGATLPGGSDDAFQRVVKAPDGTLYVAYSQTSTYNQICKIYVHKWNGSSWVDITNSGTQIFSSTYSNFNNFSFDIAFDSNSIPFVIYQNTGIDNRAYVKKYNSSTSNWDMARSGQVGGFYVEDGVRLFIDNAGLPYYVGTSGAEPKVYVIENKPVFNTTSFLPSSGPVGTTVNLYGGNFTGTTDVSFNGIPATFTTNSNTSITATVPANASTGPISVTNAAGTSATSYNFTVPPINGSIAFAGTNQYTNTTVVAPGTTSTTYEMWFRQSNTTPSTQGLLQTRSGTTGGDGIDVSITNGNITVSTSGSFLLVGAGTVNPNTWYHLAVVRNGATAWTVYLNGTSIGTFSFSSTTSTDLSLGRKSAVGYDEFFIGNISNFRYVKGTAVYTANFTPPTAALTAISGTQLLLNTYTGNGFLNDNSGNNYSTTNGNTVTSSTYEPFTPTPYPLPTITSLTPAIGLVGTTVTLTGNYFTGTTDVKFNGTTAAFTVNSATSITTTVPANATTGTITVTNASGTTTSSSNYTVLATPPTITSFTPSSGPVGTAVTITGTGFDATAANNTVYFDGVKAIVTSASTTQLVVTFPSGTSGFSELSVINTTNKSAAVSNKKFSTTFTNTGFVNYSTSSFAPQLDFTAVTNTTYTSFYGGYLKTPCLYADFNLDGKPDYVQTGDATTAVIPNTSTIALISFGTKIILNSGGNGAKVGDIDNDGLLDLIINSATNIYVYKNTSTIGGTISFATPITIAFALDKNKVLLKDMNGDGLLDLIGSNSSTISYLLNTTTGSTINFNTASPVAITAPAAVVDFGVVNLDNNAQLDIIALHSTGYSIRLNSTAFSSVVSSANSATNIVIGDINNDGYIDFAIDAIGTSAKFFQNNGSNTFTETAVSMTGGTIRSLSLAEMNGNALPELVAPQYIAPRGFILANNTSTAGISFTSGTQLTYSLSGYNVAGVANDIDGDGRPDYTTLIALNAGSDVYTVFRNIIGLPTITSFTPTSGNTGTSITITGTGFTSATAVTINGNAVTSFTVNSDTSITAVVPSGTDGPIRVTNAGGTNISSSNFTYTPTVFTTGTLTAFSKCSGLASAAQTFTVSANNLTANLVVAAYTGLEYSLDGTTYSSTLSIAPTSGTVASTTIYVRMTAASTSLTTGSISLTSTGATSLTKSVSGTVNVLPTITLGSVFAIVPSATTFTIPYSAITNSPTTYSVSTGTNALANFVPIIDATFSGATGNLAVAIPANSTPGTYDFNVKVKIGTTGCESVVYAVPVTILQAAPTITSFSPTSATVGTQVIITGTGFSTTPANNIVYFGPTTAVVSAATATSLTVTVPPGATNANIVVLNTSNTLVAMSNDYFIPLYSPARTDIKSTDYAPRVSFAGLKAAYTVAVGDLDGDGKPDLAVGGNTNQNKITVYRNTSSSNIINGSSFATGVDYVVGAYPQSISIGDLDGDGKLDIVVCNGNSSSISVLKNTSSSGTISASSFATKVDFACGTSPLNAAIKDLDLDGKPEISVANNGSNSISVFKNKITSGVINTSSFGPKVDFTTGTQPYTVIFADIDSDNKPDMVCTNGASGSISVFKNISTQGVISSNTFDTKIDFTVGTNPRIATFVDVDRDNKLDLVVTNNGSSSFSVLKNNSTAGTITSSSFAAKVDFTTGGTPYAISAGDINGDGKIDLAVTNSTNNTFSLFKNTGTNGTINSGSFATKVDFPTIYNTYSVIIADLDLEGKPEIIYTNYSDTDVTQNISVLKFNNFDVLGTLSSFSTCMGSPSAAQTLTIQGDNLSANIVVAALTGYEYSLDGTNYSSTATIVPISGTVAATTLYVRLTGATAGSPAGNISISSTNATTIPIAVTGTVNVSPTITLGSISSGLVSSTSFNIPYTATTGSPTLYSVGTGTNALANFVPIVDSTFSGATGNLAVAIPANSALGTYNFNITVKNTITSCTSTVYPVSFSITPPPPTITSFSPSSGEVGSTVTITGTGFSTTAANNSVFFGSVKATITAATTTGLTVTVPKSSIYAPITVVSNNLLVKTNGFFRVVNNPIAPNSISNNNFGNNIAISSTNGSWYSGWNDMYIAVGDFDNDGMVDVVKGGSNQVRVHRNLMTGPSTISTSSFDAGTNLTVSGRPRSIIVEDINSDGKLDIITGSDSGVSVLINTSTGSGVISFATALNLASSYANTVRAADFDSDGKLDLVTIRSASVAIYRNTSTSTFSLAAEQVVNIPTLTNCTTMGVGDFNKDSKPDIVVSNSTNTSILLNGSSVGNINFPNTIALTGGGGSIVIADYDNEGDPDIYLSNRIIVNNYSSGNISSSNFSTFTYSADGGASAYSVSDLNGDGKVEIVGGSTWDANYIMLVGNLPISSSSISSISYFVAKTYGYTAGIGLGVDVDGDNKVDYISGANYANIFSVTQNIMMPAPIISISGTLTPFAKCSGAVSATQTFTVSGSNLTANIAIAAVSGYEYSLDGTSYSSTLSIPFGSGTVAATTVYVRLTAASTGTPSGNVSITSTGATSQTIAVLGTVTAFPTIASQPLASVSLCQNISYTLSVNPSNVTSMQWYSNTTNSNTGGTSLGSANFAQSPGVQIDTTTPGTLYYYIILNNGNCSFTSSVSAITVSPTPVAGTAASADATLCSGNSTSLSLSGSTGAIQWQQSSNNSTWANVTGGTGATTANYTTPNLTATTYYKAIVTSGACTAATSNVITVTVPAVPYPYDRAVNFTNGGYLSRATTSSLGLTNFTAEAWIYPTTFKNWAGIVSKQDFQLMTTNTGKLAIMIESGWSWEWTATATNVLNLNQWQHVAASYNASTKQAKLYVNGVLVHTWTRSQNFTPNFTTAPLVVGYNNGQGNQPSTPYERNFIGNIDEVKVWNTIRTDSELATNYANQLVGNESGLVAYYKFDQGIGSGNNTAITSFTDLTANANHLTPTSMTMNSTTDNILQVGPAILSSPAMCLNSIATITHTHTGGTWSTSNAAIISIDTNSGEATANSVGTATINYTFTVGGCTYTSTKLFTVNALPAAPTATTPINYCQGATATALTPTVTTGNTLQWYTVATNGTASTTAPTPITTTVANTDYFVSQKSNTTGCESPRTTITVNVNAMPTITGVQNMSVGGSTLQLTGSGTPATTNPWVSGTPAIASVSNTGVVSPVAVGSTIITYTNASGCSTTATIAVKDCASPFSNALSFGNGTMASNADYVQINSRIFPSQTVSNFTIETWIKPAASDIVAGTTGTTWFAVLGYSGVKRSPSLYITNNGVLHVSWQEGSVLNGTPVSASSPTSLILDKWSHVAIVKDGTTMRLYVNGVQIQSVTCAATIDIPDNAYWIGKSDNQFNGTLDEVRFWSTARTQADIISKMNSELVGNETGLITYFDFNQGVGGGTNTSITTVTNKANNTLNGTLNSFTRAGIISNFVGSTIANLDISGAATICANSSSQYTHPITGGTWSISTSGANATVSASGLVTSAANENITLSYTYTLNGCSFTASKAISVNTPAAPAATAAVNLCQGGSVTALTATALTGHTLQWYTVATAGTASTTAPSPSTTTSASTSYYVSQKSNVAGCESPRTTIVVSVNPATAITTQPVSPSAVCLNASSNTISVTAIGQNLTYQWYTNSTNSTTGATAISSATTDSYAIPTTVAGTKYYYVVISGTCGSSVTSSIVSQVINIATFSTDVSSAEQNIAYGGTLTALTVVSAGATAYQWYSTPTNPSLVSGFNSGIGWTSSTGAFQAYALYSGGSPAIDSNGYLRFAFISPSSIYKEFTLDQTATTITFSAQYASLDNNNDRGKIQLYFYNASNTQVGSVVESATLTGSSAWQSIALTNTAIPAGATKVRVVFYQIQEYPNWAGNYGIAFRNPSVSTNVALNGTAISGATSATYTPVSTTPGGLYYYVVASGGCSTATSSLSGLVTVAKATPVLSNFNAISKTTNDAAFTLTAPTSSGGTGAITYSSSNSAVATIVGNTVTITGTGVTTITATQAADTNYNSQTISAQLTVGVGTTQTPILTHPASNISGATTFRINYSLPETPMAGSVKLTFVSVNGGSPIVWTLSNATSADFNYTVTTQPNSTYVSSGTALPYGTYNVTLSYRDIFGSPAAESLTNTNIQTLAPPSISIVSNSYRGFVNTAFTAISVTSTGGAVSSFTINPSLPAGLTLNTTTGVISGTPTAAITSTTYTITATNPAGTATATFTLTVDTDSDGDGVPDSVEIQQGTNPNSATSYLDTDHDGVPDYVEVLQGTNPNSATSYLDTDHDGVPDFIEVLQGTNPNLAGDALDTDHDGVPDYIEIQQGTNPNSATGNLDTDHDGVPDYIEVLQGTNPNSATSYLDTDHDGVPDFIEVLQGTNPNLAGDALDTDHDGVPDYIEVLQGTNPNLAGDALDTDHDGVPDYIEVLQGTNPNLAGDALDTDHDGVPDYIEVIQGTNPNLAGDALDTDHDGVPDYIEIQQGTNPSVPGALDTDGDGVPDYIEVLQGTNPRLSGDALDTNGNGLPDFYDANNVAPTNSILTNNMISENNSIGVVIGTLSTTDTIDNYAHTYTLVSGTGSVDNASFSIVGNQLKATSVFDFETKSSYSIRVKTTDAGGLSYEKAFTISVTNVNETPILSVSQSSYLGVVGVPLTTITIANAGAPATAYAISPALPAGLLFNTTTGSISGTPIVALTSRTYTVSGTNLDGTSTVSFTLLIDQDTDRDGLLDSIDTDDDGDGVLDVNDAFPINKNEWTDTDRDGIGNNADTDDDNDGILDGCDVDANGDSIPDNGTDLDGDGINDSCDQDKDGDGVNNASDNCPSSPNRNQADRDQDGLGDVCDTIEINASQAITPNGDGINDTWVIYNLSNHPGSTVRVFNSNGTQVFYSANYQNNWTGNYQGSSEMLPVGSYLYQIDLGGDGSIDEQGWLYITK